MARYAVCDRSAAHAASGTRRPDELTFQLDHSIGAGQRSFVNRLSGKGCRCDQDSLFLLRMHVLDEHASGAGGRY
jgi:hypothetical protein